VALVTAVAVVALLGLRASVPQAAPAAPAAPPRPVPVGLVPTPPYDRLPGRTPIPAPSLVGEDGQTIGGELPVFAPAPSQLAVRIAVRMILNRFCREPAGHRIHFDPGVGTSWRSATAVVSPPRSRLADRPMIILRLFWTGYTYRWRGSLYQLADCG
jgi:hypothetical protein